MRKIPLFFSLSHQAVSAPRIIPLFLYLLHQKGDLSATYNTTISLSPPSGGLSTTAMVKVQLTDVNDNRPTFYPKQYNVSLRENHVSSSPVVVVVATDTDSGTYGQVTVEFNVILRFKINDTRACEIEYSILITKLIIWNSADVN